MSTFDSLNDTFDIEPAPIEKVEKDKKPIKLSNKQDDREKDYSYARAQLYDLVEKMQESLDGAMEVAQQTCHPRAWEVALNGAKNAAEVVEKLSTLQQAHKRLDEEELQRAPQHQGGMTQNNIFMSGSTSDLMAMLKDANKLNGAKGDP